MATVIENTVSVIDSQLTELNTQVAQLKAARAALVGGGRVASKPAVAAAATAAVPALKRGPGRPRKSSTASSTAAKRGRKPGSGSRSSEALALITANPGIRISDMAKQMGIGANYLYRIMPGLEKNGSIKKDGKGWVAVSA